MFQSGLAAFQIMKPVETLGLIHRGEQNGSSILVTTHAALARL